MPSARNKIIFKVALDVVLLVLTALPVLIFFVAGSPYRRGFFCNDETIKYPYKDSTVTSLTLYFVGTALPILSMVAVEYYNTFRSNGASASSSWSTYFWTLYCYIGAFLFGCATSHTIVDICKYTVGRLRPHFIAVCLPDLSVTTCEEDPYAYVPYNVTKCLGKSSYTRMRETRLSFMSGHSSFSTYTMVFLILYLQARFRTKISLVKPIFQHACFIIAIFTCLSRVQDNKHHWSDVFAGFVNGLFFAVFVALWVAKLFRKRSSHKEDGSSFPLEDPIRPPTLPYMVNQNSQQV